MYVYMYEWMYVFTYVGMFIYETFRADNLAHICIKCELRNEHM